MLKHIKTGTVTLMTIVFLIVFLFSASSEMIVQTTVDLGRYYETMIFLFEQQNYDAAKACINDHNLNNYEDTPAYILYIDAALAFDAALKDFQSGKTSKTETIGNFEMTLDQFDGLANQNFKDSNLWNEYINAFIAELSEDYVTAIEGYKSVILFQDSSERLASCRKSLKSSSELIAEQLRQEQYDDAVRSSTQARASRDIDTMKKARALFDDLGDYKDSKTQAAECSTWIASASRVLTLYAASTSETSIGLKVADSNPGPQSQYIAEVTVLGNHSASKKLTFTETSTEIKDLLPNTAYTIQVYDADQMTIHADTEAVTYAAPLWENGKYKVVYRSLYGFRRIYLDLLSEEEIIENYSILERQEDAILNLIQADIDEQKMAYLTMLTFDDGFMSMQGETHEIRSILRVNNHGAYSSAPKIIKFAGETIIVHLEDLLDTYYNDLGMWLDENMTLELYFDGTLAGNMTLRVKVAQ